MDASADGPAASDGPAHAFLSDGTERLYFHAQRGAGRGVLRSARWATQGTVEIDDLAPTARLDPLGPADALGGRISVRGTATDRAWDDTARNFLAYSLSAEAPGGSVLEVASGRAPVEDGLLAVWDTLGLPGGAYRLRLTVDDVAGNSSEATLDVPVVPDPCAPPRILWPGAVPGGEVVADDYVVLIHGSAAAGATVRLAVDGVLQAVTAAAADGSWAVPGVLLREGLNEVTATTCPDRSDTLLVRVDLLELLVATDRPRYRSGDTVTLTVRAIGDRPDRRASLVLDGPGRSMPLALGSVPTDGLERTRTWLVSEAPPGGYRALLRGYRDVADGRAVVQAEASFEVVGEPELEVELSTERPSYTANSVVRLRGRVRNTSPNGTAQDVQSTLSVQPLGGDALRGVQPQSLRHGPLPPGEGAPHLAQWSTGQHRPGEYLATLRATADALAPVEAAAVFRVEGTDAGGAGLVGTLEAAPRRVDAGEPVTLSYTARNDGNAALANAPLRIHVLTPADGREHAQPLDETLDLAVGGEQAGQVEQPSDGLADGFYLAVLRAEVAGEQRTLASASFEVRAFGATGALLAAPPRAVGLLRGPAAPTAHDDSEAALQRAGYELLATDDPAEFGALLRSDAERLVLLYDPEAALPEAFDGRTLRSPAQGELQVEVAGSRLLAPASLYLDADGAWSRLAHRIGPGDTARSAAPLAAGGVFRLVLRVWGDELGRDFGVYDLASDGPSCRVRELALGRWEVSCGGLPLGLARPGPGDGQVVLLLTAAGAAAEVPWGDTLADLVEGGATLVDLNTALGALDERLLGARVRGRHGAGPRRLVVPADGLPDPGPGAGVHGGPLDLELAGATVVAELAGRVAAPGPVSGLRIPVAGQAEVRVEQLSRALPQALELVAPTRDTLAARLRPGVTYALPSPLAAGDELVLALVPDDSSLGGDGLTPLLPGVAGGGVERLSFSEWSVRLPALPERLRSRAPAEQRDTVLTVALLGEGEEHTPAALRHAPGEGHVLLLGVDLPAEPDPAARAWLASALQATAPPADRSAPGGVVRVRIAGTSGAVAGAADLSVSLPAEVTVVQAPDAVIIPGADERLRWEGVPLGQRQPFSRSFVIRLPQQPGRVVLRAELTPSGEAQPVFPLGELALEVEQP